MSLFMTIITVWWQDGEAALGLGSGQWGRYWGSSPVSHLQSPDFALESHEGREGLA